jgi:hypothetical protein
MTFIRERKLRRLVGSDIPQIALKFLFRDANFQHTLESVAPSKAPGFFYLSLFLKTYNLIKRMGCMLGYGFCSIRITGRGANAVVEPERILRRRVHRRRSPQFCTSRALGIINVRQQYQWRCIGFFAQDFQFNVDRFAFVFVLRHVQVLPERV